MLVASLRDGVKPPLWTCQYNIPMSQDRPGDVHCYPQGAPMHNLSWRSGVWGLPKYCRCGSYRKVKDVLSMRRRIRLLGHPFIARDNLCQLKSA